MERKNSFKYKKTVIFLLCIGILFIGKTGAISAGKVVNIYVIKSLNIKPYNSALKGFFESLEEKGYTEGKNLILNYYLLKGKRKEEKTIIKKIEEEKPDLILTVGTEATKKIHQAEIRDVPVIFLMVLDPRKNGFVKSNQNSGNNFTGTTMKIPVYLHWQAMKSVIPGIENIGVMYNPLESSEMIKNADSFAKKNRMELKAVSVLSSKDVPNVLTGLISEINMLWLIPDSTVDSEQSLQYILSLTLKNKVPVMGYAAHLVQKGALLALSCDYEDIGRQGGELSWKIINGENPGTLPVTFPRKALLSVNVRVAKHVGIEIPVQILKEAYKVFN